MAKSAQADTEQLTRETSIQRLIEGRGVRLVRRGTNLVGSCPFHRSSKFTLAIDARVNTWTCSGKCRVKAGTVIDWTMRAEGVSRTHAIELLRTGSTTSAPTTAKPAKKSTVKKLPVFADAEEPDHVVMAKVIDYYHECLKSSPQALAFLRETGFRPEAIEHFRLGFVDRTLGYRLPERNRKAGKAIRGQLARLGILRDSGHEHFRGCVTFPIIDGAGHVQQVYGHRVGHSTRGEPTELWLDPKKKAVFNVAGIMAPMVILCSSAIHAITFWCSSCASVTAVNGFYGFGTEHLEALKAKQVTQVMIAFERSEKANKAAEKLGAMLAEHGITSCRVTLPQGMTPTEYVLEGPPPGKGLDVLVRHATWIAGSRPVQEQQVPEVDIHGEVRAADKLDDNKDADHEVVLRFDDRRWRVRGLARNTSPEKLSVNILVARTQEEHGPFHVDAFDLYSAKHRGAFAKEAAVELGLDEAIIKADMGRVLLELERLQHAALDAAKAEAKKYEMTDAEREEALKLLRDPKLVDRALADLERCGLVGEPLNKLVAYLTTVSRKLDDPLAVVIQSSSAAGKSSLMDAVLAFVPDEDKVHFSAMTGQSLYYMGETELAHRVLSLAEEAGARRSSYALKLLQSEGQLTIASTGKEPSTGRLITQEYRVRGPVALMMTTTDLDLDEELLNRCIVLAVDEGREQTRAIHALQRQRHTLEGLLARQDKEAIIRLHQNAQRLLREVRVVNPFVRELAFEADQARSRRDHAKFLNLIRTVTLLHQYQRPAKQVEHRGHRLDFIEVARSDIELVGKLAAHVLQSEGDLPPQTRLVLDGIKTLVVKLAAELKLEPAAVKLTQRMIREHLGLSTTPARRHLHRLVELEYLIVLRGGPRKQTFYQYDARCTQSGLTGLTLDSPMVSPIEAKDSAGLSPLDSPNAKAHQGTSGKSTSYPQVRR